MAGPHIRRRLTQSPLPAPASPPIRLDISPSLQPHLQPATAAPEGVSRARTGSPQDLGTRLELLPVPTHKARWVHAPLQQLPGMGSTRDALGSSPGLSTPNSFHVSTSTEPFF